MVPRKGREVRLMLVTLVASAISLITGTLVESAKVVDLGDNLPDLLQQHPDKGWLVKFYAPWCHHCQQLEPTYVNLAERIYHRHDNLIVARVDCTKYGKICGEFAIDSYPTILYLHRTLRIRYNGDRSEESMLSFADRLTNPSINKVGDCNHLRDVTNKHGLIVLSSIRNTSDEIRREFESTADNHKSEYWFYQIDKLCKNLIPSEGLFILKRHLNKPIQLDLNTASPGVGLGNQTIIEWIRNQSYPVYGRITRGNMESLMSLNKTLIVAILDEYRPAKRFASSSTKLHKTMEKLAKHYAQQDDQLLFGWTSDVELVEYLTISSVAAPNILLIKNDFRYHLIGDPSSKQSATNDKNDDIPIGLKEQNIRTILAAVKADKLDFSGGSSYLYGIFRLIFSKYSNFIRMYKANPLLVSLIFVFPSIIIMFVVYTTCFYDGPTGEDDPYNDDEEQYSDDEESQNLLSNNHLKQD